jgi:hypothetical protein
MTVSSVMVGLIIVGFTALVEINIKDMENETKKVFENIE